ncbi:hypothetical protein C8R43DRAFT_848866, partial [Mycena crocata]
SSKYILYANSGVRLLLRGVAMEALHNSSERFVEPACHPGTRSVVLQELLEWSIDTDRQRTILWLHGCAGIGKSAVAQTFAGKLEDAGRLGASFFFKRGHAKMGTSKYLIPTIAFQLAQAVAELCGPIQKAVESNKLVSGLSMAAAFEQLLLKPFKEPVHGPPRIIILEGLDECDTPKVQKEILRLFIDAVRGHALPVRLLIVSRSEQHIREILEPEHAFGICSDYTLSADEAAHQDIGIYLQKEFSRIRAEPRVEGLIGSDWPGPDVIKHLTKMSSGTFIYAATVIAFIGDD